MWHTDKPNVRAYRRVLSNVKKRPGLQTLIVLLSSIGLSFIIGRDYLTAPGYIYLAEQFEVQTVEGFWNVAYPVWDERLQEFSFVERPKIYYYALLMFLGQATGSYRALQTSALLIPISAGFLTAFVLNRYWICRATDLSKHDWRIFGASVFSAFLFVVNPWFVMNPRNIVFRLQFALFPIILYLFIRLIEDRRYSWGVGFAIVTGLIASFRFTLILSLLIGLLLVVHAFSSKDPLRTFRSSVSLAIVSYLLFLGISAVRFLPAILYARRSSLGAIQQFTPSLVQREPILHIFTTKIYTWTAVGFEFVYDDRSHFLFLLVSAFSLTALLVHRDRFASEFHRLLLPVIIVAFVPLSAQSFNFDAMLLQLPHAGFHGRLLRHARWNVVPIILALTVLAGVAAVRFLQWRRRPATLLLLVLTLLAAGSAWPLYTGDMNGYWNPNPPPEEYLEVNDVLVQEQTDADTSHVLWVPGTLRKATWSAQSGVRPNSAPTGLYPVRSSALPSYDARSFYYFDYYWPVEGGPSRTGQPVFEGNLSRLYDPPNVDYVAFHSDETRYPPGSDQRPPDDVYRDASERFAGRPWSSTMYSGSYIQAYDLKSNTREFTVRNPIAVRGGLTAVSSVSSVNDDSIPGVVFVTDGNAGAPTIDPSAPYVVDDPGHPVDVSEAAILVPAARFTDTTEDSEWTTSDVRSPSFHRRLAERGIRWSWQFDYGSGLAMTDSSSAIPDGVEADTANRVGHWEFDTGEDVAAWNAHTDSINQSLSHDGSALKVNLTASNFGWRTVQSPPIDATGSGVYRFSLTVRGDPAHEVHAKVVERGTGGDVLEVNRVATIDDGTFGPKHIEFDYRPENRSVASIQLAIWHGHQTTKPLPNQLWVDSVAVHDMSPYAEPVHLTETVRVEDDGRYRVFVRTLRNRDGGRIGVSVDGDTEAVETEGRRDSLEWMPAGTYSLESGSHRITVANEQGFNAINLVALLPVGGSESDTATPDRNRTVAYLLEGESDFTSANGTVAIRERASNGQVLRLPENQSASSSVYIADSGRYQIAARLGSQTAMAIDGHDLQPSRTEGRFTYYGPVDLAQGAHSISLEASSVDVVWLYTTPGDADDRTLQDVFATDANPAAVESYEKVDPTKYKVQVNASEPYMLSFAEGYDPLWVAEVQTPNGTKQIEPTPLYGVINGFWIEEPGEYTVTIRYRPQRWFYYGAAISGTTFVLSIAYLFYDWRRRRRDEWAVATHERWASARTRAKEALVRSARRLAE